MLSGRFVTACYLTLDAPRGRVAYSNAGHNPPLLVRRSGEVVRLARGGTVLGVFPDAVYDEGRESLGPGDRLLLYTDGITEAIAAGDIEYGEDRLAEVARAHRGDSATTLVEAVLQDVDAFTGSTLRDDATVLAALLRG
jgi:sigma-B regulation protein RsbU (phosphoserine phosphatase)